MASVACKLVRLEVTSYEMGEVTNGREKGTGRMRRRSRREGGTRDDARVSRNAAVPPN